MARFLSAEWLEQVAAAARDDPGVQAAASGVSLTVQQVVTDGPDGDVAWHVRLGDGSVEIGPGRAPDAEVVITQSHETATEVGRGDLSPAEAFATGRLKLAGQVGLLIRHQPAFERLGHALAAVREATTFS
ncbi:MAG: SCP2 sterol-binding domain-containing protein [Actinobacteria bacterium]|nr:MAG: SCP2 sterol-binding domain-containing protein [Actinomycetota bacterium]